jgi:glycosyltransferase 2 family protein
MSRLRNSKALRVGLQGLFIGVVLFFLIRTLVASWAQIIAFPWHFRALPLIGSLGVSIIAGVFWASVWRLMVVQTGSSIAWADGVRVYLVSNLAKYVPGSIWGYVSRAYLGRDYGVTLARVGVSTVWEVGFAIVASLLLTVMALPFLPVKLPVRVFSLVVAVAVISLILLLPPVFSRWMRFLGRSWPTAESLVFRWHDFGMYLGAAFLTQVLVGTAFFLFAAALVDLSPRDWWGLASAWSFSSTAGLVILLAPYGLGVREGVLTLFLRAFMPLGAAVLVALVSRLWTIVIELILAGLALLLLPKSTRYSIRVIDFPPQTK